MAMQKTMKRYCLPAVFFLLAANVSSAPDSVRPAPGALRFVDSDSVNRPDIIRPPSMPVEQEDNYREQYDRLLESLANGEYSEAEIAAKVMVTLSLPHGDSEGSGLPQALINLAATQQLSQDFSTAILNYQASIKHIENRGDLLSPDLVAPLRGLASAQTANDNPAAGLRTLDRALHISNVNKGPHSLDQLPILDSMLKTHLQHHDVDDTKKLLGRIDTLARHAYPPGSEELLPALFYKARIEGQLGMQLDERQTYREIIRISARQRGDDHISLIEPYLKIANTYVRDAEGNNYRSLPTAPTAEWYFKKAIAITESSEEADILTKENCLLSLADYYTVIGAEGKADTLYREAWDLLSSDQRYGEQRDADLGGLKPLIQVQPNRYADFEYKSGIYESKPEDLLQGTVTIAYTVRRDGTTKRIEIVEAEPPGFEKMELRVRNAAKDFRFRPRYVNGKAVEVRDQRYRHEYFYQTSDLHGSGNESRGRSIPDTARIN